jgi:uncharacterized membrane protein
MYARLKILLKQTFTSPVRSFIVVASVFGLVTIALVPPFTGADEEAHFIRTYGISEGVLVMNTGDDTVEMPTSYRKTLGCMQVKQPVGGDIYKYMYGVYGERKGDALQCAFSVSLDEGETEPLKTTAAGYSPTTYIPQVIAVSIGKVFNMPIVMMSYLSRLAVLAAYIVLIAAAIKVLPSRKWALVGMALLPVSIIQVTNPGGDYLLLGAIALFIATIIRSLVLKGDQDKKLLILGTVTAILMVLPKGIFPGILFLPLIFFFGGLKKNLAIKSGIFVGVSVIALLWQKFGVSTVLGGVNASTNSIFDFPFAFTKTMFYGWIDKDFIYNGIGFGLGAQVGMPAIIVTLMTLLIGMYLFADFVKDKIKNKLLTIVSIIIAVGVVVGSFAALYVAGSYLQDDSNVIKGVQPRYFYPALFLIAMIPFARAFTTSRRFYILAVLIGSSILLSAQVLAIAIQYRWGIF